jgi:hypothetical protein
MISSIVANATFEGKTLGAVNALPYQSLAAGVAPGWRLDVSSQLR